MLRSGRRLAPRAAFVDWARRLGRADIGCRLLHRCADAQWAGAVSQLVSLAEEQRKRSHHNALPGDPWEEGARAVLLGEALELMQHLAQRDRTGKLHEQNVLSDVSWALASLGVHDHTLLQVSQPFLP